MTRVEIERTPEERLDFWAEEFTPGAIYRACTQAVRYTCALGQGEPGSLQLTRNQVGPLPEVDRRGWTVVGPPPVEKGRKITVVRRVEVEFDQCPIEGIAAIASARFRCKVQADLIEPLHFGSLKKMLLPDVLRFGDVVRPRWVIYYEIDPVRARTIDTPVSTPHTKIIRVVELPNWSGARLLGGGKLHTLPPAADPAAAWRAIPDSYRGRVTRLIERMGEHAGDMELD